MPNDLVTLILPVFQCEAALEACLRGALEQDYDPLQVWAVDNGSSDHSYDVLLDFERRYRRRLFVGRLYGTLNPHGLDEHILRMINPRSTYLQRLVPALVLAPGCVRRSLELLAGDGALRYVAAHADSLLPDGSVRPLPPAHPADCVLAGPDQMGDLLVHGRPAGFASLYRAEMFRKIYDEAYVFDHHLDLFHQFVAASMGEVGYLREPQGWLRQPPECGPLQGAPGMTELVERYVFIQGMGTIARRIRRPQVADRLPEALRQLSGQCLDWAERLRQTGDLATARRYGFLGLAFGAEPGSLAWLEEQA
jgi:hypothetical protein